MHGNDNNKKKGKHKFVLYLHSKNKSTAYIRINITPWCFPPGKEWPKSTGLWCNWSRKGPLGLWGAPGPASLSAGSLLSAGKDPTLESALLTISGITQRDKTEPRTREQVKTSLWAFLLFDKEVNSERIGSKLPVFQHLLFCSNLVCCWFPKHPSFGSKPYLIYT